MRSITIDISDKVYKLFTELMEKLPKGSFKIYDDDPDFLTAEEKKAYYASEDEIHKNDFSDYVNWDDIKEDF